MQKNMNLSELLSQHYSHIPNPISVNLWSCYSRLLTFLVAILSTLKAHFPPSYYSWSRIWDIIATYYDLGTQGRSYHRAGPHHRIPSSHPFDTRKCVICHRTAARPQTQWFGHMPMERITPDLVFDKIGLDYAGPLYIKYGFTRRPTIVKAYVCIFIFLSVKAVHLELVSDLTSEVFIACLQRFIPKREAYPLVE